MKKYIILIGLIFFISNNLVAQKAMTKDKYNKLTADEKRVIIDKGTEYPGTGKHLKNKAVGSTARTVSLIRNVVGQVSTMKLKEPLNTFPMLMEDEQKLFALIVMDILDMFLKEKDLPRKTPGIV